jgi:RNA polymerase sigma factor for flagellar operon FliA
MLDCTVMGPYTAHAKHRVKGATLRQLDWASRDLRRRHKQLEAATRKLTSESQRALAEAELAAKLGVGIDRWRPRYSI